MFADPQPFPYEVNSPAEATLDWTRMRIADGNTVYKNLTGATDWPLTLTVQHMQVGKGKDVRQRHMVRLETPARDADGVVVTGKNLVAYLVVDCPDTQVSSNAKHRMWATLSGLIGGKGGTRDYGDPDTFWTRFLSGES